MNKKALLHFGPGPSSVESQVKQNCCKVSIHHERKTKHSNKLCSEHVALNAA